MNNKKNIKFNFKIIILAFALLIFTCCSCNFQSKTVLPSWENNSQNKQEIINYVKDVTDKKSADFVPVEDRIAVFDADGTYYCEKTDFVPNYFARFVADYRLKNDPSFTPSSELKASIDDGFLRQEQQLEILYSMTNDQIYNLAEEFKNTPQPCFNNLTFGEAFYKPMLELINYLQENNFTVYVVSGTDQDVLRGMANGVLNIPKNQLCGSEIFMSKEGADQLPRNEYNIEQNDKVGRTQNFIANDKFEKVDTIHNVIGKRPIFAAGNSSGDFSMLNYTMANPNYKPFTLMVSHDDDQREFVYPKGDKLNEIQQAIDTNGYHKVSMKDEFKTIFKDGVTKKAPGEYRVYQED